MAYFQFDHFPKSEIDSESRFEMRMSIFLFKIFMESFDHHIKMFNNGFSMVFSKSDLALYHQKEMSGTSTTTIKKVIYVQ